MLDKLWEIKASNREGSWVIGSVQNGEEDSQDLEILFLKVADIFPPEESVFVDWRPVKMAKKYFLFILVK